MNHKKLIIVAIWIGLIGTLTTLGWELPVQSVSNPECEKGVHWDDMSEDCKLSLTEKGAINTESVGYGHFILSALRGASYNNPRTPGSGSHPSLDIVSAEGTPVNSIGDGIVVLAGVRAGYGKSVTVKHTLEGENIYSNYSHLEAIKTSVGNTVDQGDVLGTIGRTGFTIGPFGYHLDFQITTQDSPSHPYGLHDCETGYYQAVNNGDCRDKVEKYTIDPVEFFVQYSAYNLHPLAGTSGKGAQETAKEPQEDHAAAPEIVENSTPVEDTVEETADNEEITDVVTPSPIIEAPIELINALQDVPVALHVNKSIFASLQSSFTSRNRITALAGEGVVEEVSVEEVKSNDTSLAYEVDWTIGHGDGTMEQHKVTPFVLHVTDHVKARWNGTLDERIHFRFNENELDIIPSSFSSVVEGKKHIFIKAKKAGYASITIMHGDQELGSEVVYIQPK